MNLLYNRINTLIHHKKYEKQKKHNFKTACKIICNNYKDIPCSDTSENVFYIYYLGRYNNTHTYHYGETNDIYSIEFNLSKKLPMYKKLTNIPVDSHIDGYDNFSKFLKKNNLITNNFLTKFPIDIENIFTTNDNVSIDEILSFVTETFNEVETV